MRTLKSLKEIEVLDSSKLKIIKGGLINPESGKSTSFTNIKSTCDGVNEDQSGLSRTDNWDGGKWIYGPWNPYNTTSQGDFH